MSAGGGAKSGGDGEKPAAEPAAPAETAARPAETAAKPAETAAKPADPAAEPAETAKAPATAAQAVTPAQAAQAVTPAQAAKAVTPAQAAKAADPVKPAKPAKPAGPEIPKAPPWWRALRAEPPAHLRAALGLAMVAALLALWWLVTRGDAEGRIISPARLPSPGEVVGQIHSRTERALGDSVMDTLERVFIGVGLAALVGVTAGVIASSNRGIGAVLNPLVIFLRSVPMGALFPLTLLLFSEQRQKTMFLFLAIVGFVFSDTVKAMMSVPERFVETAQTLGASRFQIIRKVLVPLALPDIVTSLRFQFGLALGYVMLAEEYNTRHGLGQMINMSQRLGETEHVYLLLVLIAVLAFGIDLILRTLQRGLFTWRKDL